MDLPESYTYWNKSRKKEAYIENGILKLCTSEIYKKVIRELAYILNGSKHYCVYCNKSIQNNKATLDHVYPQFLGGPTITNNLVPSCQNCNSEKSDFTKDEFIEYLCLRHKNRQKAKEFRSIANLQKNVCISLTNMKFLMNGLAIKKFQRFMCNSLLWIFLQNGINIPE